MRSVFVTGATGLLGNNLVRELVARGYTVKGLVRSKAKGEQQFNNLPGVELVVGDMAKVDAFAASLQGCDTVFHTAAFFRDNYKGGSHGNELEQINVSGTQRLLEQGLPRRHSTVHPYVFHCRAQRRTWHVHRGELPEGRRRRR
ncbi:NAD(P)H-binding protein [Pseudomonas putida]|uniref:NAD(P)H-binding protein n=1 Tax=Pseudomonas putida TaxID=303 RepID=UPI0039B70091